MSIIKIKPQPSSDSYAAAQTMTEEEWIAYVKENSPKFYETKKARLLLAIGTVVTAVAVIASLRAKEVEIPVIDDVIESITD